MLARLTLLLSSPILFIVSGCSDSNSGGSTVTTRTFKTESLMTAQDTLNSSESNISITNGAGEQITASGVYIASIDINDCSSCYGSVVAGSNTSGGFAEPITFSSGQTIKIGQNYLYNLIYSGIN